MSAAVAVTLVTALHECAKCAACEQMIARLERARPGQIILRKIPCDSAEACDLGVVMPPMLIVDDLLVSAGGVPSEEAISRLIDAQIAEGSRS